MKLVIDSNIIISALIKDSTTREIILKSGIEFYHPKISLSNLEKYREEIVQKSGINNKEYENLIGSLFENIIFIEKEDFLDKVEEGKIIIGNIDMEDVSFIALALSIDNDGIWSEDKHFKKQDRVKVFTTEELMKEIEKENYHS